MSHTLHTHAGRAVAPLADEITAVYAEVFGAAPWNEDAVAVAAFRDRLLADTDRPDRP